LLLLFGWLASAGPGQAKSSAGIPASELRKKGQAFEKRGMWAEACRCYEEALRKERNHTATRDAWQRCLRRLHLTTRHRDASYRQLLTKLTAVQSLDVYDQVLAALVKYYHDRSKLGFADLFRNGVQELRFALDEASFRRHHLAGIRPAALAAFKKHLAAWPNRKLANRLEVREQVLSVLQTAIKDGVPLRPATINALVLEFAAGACNALDEYSSFLTPGHYQQTRDLARGDLVGVGLELGITDDELVVTRVYPGSPAAESGLKVRDRVLRIGGRAVKDLPADVAAEKLRGKPNSSVAVEVVRGGDATKGKKTFKMTRRAVVIRSVEYKPKKLSGGDLIGVLKINFFAESTPQEIRDQLDANPSELASLKGMILDLRGNPGGLFKSALTVAEMFLDGGVIVIGQSRHKDYNKSFKAEQRDVLPLPLMVLIDGETASAAEVLAGALKDGRPGTTLIGQTTYGKGSVQCLVTMDKGPLEKLNAGIRLTVAKLLSPTSQPYTGRGIVPDFTVPAAEAKDDALNRFEKRLAKANEGMMPKPTTEEPARPSDQMTMKSSGEMGPAGEDGEMQ